MAPARVRHVTAAASRCARQSVLCGDRTAASKMPMASASMQNTTADLPRPNKVKIRSWLGRQTRLGTASLRGLLFLPLRNTKECPALFIEELDAGRPRFTDSDSDAWPP